MWYKIIPYACGFSLLYCYNQLNGYHDIYENRNILVDDYQSTKFQYCPSLASVG